MFKGASGKRFFYFLSSFLRAISFVGLLIAYIVVRIVVEPSIDWLNTLLLTLTITTFLTSAFNLMLCGFPATAYHEKKFVQYFCFAVTIFTGGIGSTICTGFAAFTKVEQEEMKNEKIFNTRTFKNKDGKQYDKEKK